jgi:peptide/nickel transport system substrate-binding protein
LVDRIIVLPVLDPTAMAIALQTGQVDIVTNASAQQVAQLKNDANVVVQFPDPANAYFVSLNCRSAVAGRGEVRQAMNYAINREAIAALFGGLARPLGHPVPRGSEVTSNAPTNVYSYQPDKAKALLKAAGVSLPMPFRLKVPSSGPGFGLSSSTVALLQQDLATVASSCNQASLNSRL